MSDKVLFGSGGDAEGASGRAEIILGDVIYEGFASGGEIVFQ